MEFLLSHHAKEQIELRGIFERDVFLTLENPDKIEFDGFGQFVYQKIFSI